MTTMAQRLRGAVAMVNEMTADELLHFAHLLHSFSHLLF